MADYDVRRVQEEAYHAYSCEPIMRAKIDLIERLLELPPKMFREFITTILVLNKEMDASVEAEKKGEKHTVPPWWPRSPFDNQAYEQLLVKSLVADRSPEAFKEYFSG
jgi:hypothetical protein